MIALKSSWGHVATQPQRGPTEATEAFTRGMVPKYRDEPVDPSQRLLEAIQTIN